MGNINILTVFSGGVGSLDITSHETGQVFHFTQVTTNVQTVTMPMGNHIFSIRGVAPAGTGGNILLKITGDIPANGKEPSNPTSANSELFTEYTKTLNDQIAKTPNVFPGKDLTGVYTYIEKKYKTTIAKIKMRPSLSLGYTYTYNQSNLQNQHAPYLTFLWGFGNTDRPWELNVQAGDSVTTDTSHVTANHNKITALPGITKVFASDKDGNALFEITFTSEFDQVTSSLYKGEKRLDWLPTGTLQARPNSKSPWISIVVKKDVNKGNFLGFLNVTFNLNNPKGSSN